MSRLRLFALSLTLGAALFTQTSVAQTKAPDVKRTVLQRHDIDTSGFEAFLVQVDLPAGSREGRHHHSGMLMIRVEQGTLTLEIEGVTKDYQPGDTVIVETGKAHEGMNKGSAPTRVSAVFTVPKGSTLTTQEQ